VSPEDAAVAPHAALQSPPGENGAKILGGKARKWRENSKLRHQRRHFYSVYRRPRLRWVDGRIALANDELVLRLGGGGVVVVAADGYMAHYSAQIINEIIKCRCMHMTQQIVKLM
jgi:hypothetical protein